MNLKKLILKIVCVIILIIYLDVYNILLREKSYKNILVYNILYKKIMDAKPLRIRFDKGDGIIKFMMELGI